MEQTMTITSFNGSVFSPTPEEREKRRHTTEKVATGTAATGTAAYQAKKYAGKKYVRSMFDNVTGTARTVQQNAREASTLLSRFKINAARFSKDAMTRLMKFQNNKYLGPIVKSKAVRGVTKGFGLVTAFFVLVTGVGEAIESGRIAIGGAKRRYDMAA